MQDNCMFNNHSIVCRFFSVSAAISLLVFVASTFLFQTWRGEVRVIVLSNALSMNNANVVANNIEALLQSATFSESMAFIQGGVLSHIRIRLHNERGSIISISADIQDSKRIASAFEEMFNHVVGVSKSYYGDKSGIEIQKFEKITYRRSLQYPLLSVVFSILIGALTAFIIEKKVFGSMRGKTLVKPTYFIPSLQAESRMNSNAALISTGSSSESLYSSDHVSVRSVGPNANIVQGGIEKDAQRNISNEMMISNIESLKNFDQHDSHDRVSEEIQKPSKEKIFDSVKTVHGAPFNLPISSDIPEYIRELTDAVAPNGDDVTLSRATSKNDDSDGMHFGQHDSLSIQAQSDTSSFEPTPAHEPTEEELKERLNTLLRGELKL